jgi:hypothetical protein
MTNSKLFEQFTPALTASVPPVVRDPRLLIASDGNVSVYYAPFEYLNPAARIVLVGITPGSTQMVNANNAARSALLAGKGTAVAMEIAKQVGAFSGEPLRSNLIRQLNDWRFQDWLGLPDASALFGESRHLVQTTSLLRYPVFVDGENYRGQPDMTRHVLLRQHLLTHFVAEVEQLPTALFLSLGPQVQKVMTALVSEGVLDAARVLTGLLHPSGNCTYRINYLTGDRLAPIPHATDPLPYDAGRRAFQQRYIFG